MESPGGIAPAMNGQPVSTSGHAEIGPDERGRQVRTSFRSVVVTFVAPIATSVV